MAVRSKVFKRCIMCHKLKSLSDYYVKKSSVDHHKDLCKSCDDKMKKNNVN